MLSYMKGSGHGGLIRLGVHSKLTNLVAPLSSYDPKLDIAIAIVLLVCALTLIRRSRIRFTVFVCVVFMILYFITPSEILTASHVDERYIVPSVLFLVLSIDPNRFRLQKMAFWLALTMMVIRTGFIGANWLSISRHSEQVLAMERVLPREARIYALPPDNPSIGLSERGFIHVIQYWTLTRDANISTLFALPGQQPLVFRQSPCEGPEWAQCFSRYDYVWTLDPPPAIEQVLFRIATPAAAYEKVTLWRVNQPLAF